MMEWLDHVAAPELWPILLAAPLTYAALWIGDRARARRLRAWIGPRSSVLANELSPRRRAVRRLLAALGLLCACLAILQPLGEESEEEIEQRGIDIVVCLDVSRSMWARDQLPNRLAAAQREIDALAATTQGDRLALVVFAGEAQLKVPLTRDTESFRDLVRLADPLDVRRGGTDLGAALEAAMAALGDPSGQHEVVLLLTDGEDLEERGLRAAETLRDRNVVVHGVGFGSARGSKITITDEDGERFLVDASGREVVTALDPASLRRIAESTGGEYVNATAVTRPLAALYEKRLRPMAQKTYDAERQRERRSLFQLPLLAAILIWIGELSITDRRRRRR